MKPVTEHMPAPLREPRHWRKSAWYKLGLFIALILLLFGIFQLLKTPPPASSLTGGVDGSPATLDSARPSLPAGTAPDQAGVRPDGQAALPPAAPASGATPASTPDAVAALRERLQALTGTPGGEGTEPGRSGGQALSGSSTRSQSGTTAGTKAASEAEAKYGVELPPYDRQAFAERQKELEALRAKTLDDLKKVSPNDPEGMLRVLERMSQGLQAQGLPNIVDMPKMEALLRGSGRLNELNAALVAEMGRAGGGRPEVMARLANEIKAVQATLPSTVYDLETVGRLMRGEQP